MSTLTQFTVTGKEKDDFYGFGVNVGSGQVIRKVVTKVISGTSKNDSIYEYALGTAYDVTTLGTPSTTSLVRNGSENSNQSGLSDIQGMCFNATGTKLYVVDKFHKRIIQYALSTAFLITSLSYEKELSVEAQDLGPVSIKFNPTGSKMYMIGNTGNPLAAPAVVAGNVNEYDVSSAFDISTAVYGRRLSVAAQDANMKDLFFNEVARGADSPGKLMFMLGEDGIDINEYLLTSAYDVSTATFVDAHSVGSEDDKPRSIQFNADGSKVYTTGQTGNEINVYTLVTANDISTTQAVQSTTSFATNTIEPRGWSFSADGYKMFVVGTGGTLCIDGGDDEETVKFHTVRTRNVIKMYEGNTYVFDVSDNNMTGSDFKFSTTSGGTKSGGVEYTTGVTTSGTIGSAGATVTIVVAKKIDSLLGGSAVADLYYYESRFTNTGGKIFTPEVKGQLQITHTNGVDDIETRFETKNQEDIFKNSFFMRAGLTFSVVNGDLKVELN